MHPQKISLFWGSITASSIEVATYSMVQPCKAFKNTKRQAPLGLCCGFRGQEGQKVVLKGIKAGPERQNLLGHINQERFTQVNTPAQEGQQIGQR